MSKYTLLTGATGLLGEYLVRDLLRGGTRLALVVRPGRRATPRERVESMMQMWEQQLGKALPRPVVFQGDVTAPHLGLSDEARRWVGQNCDRVFHNAAVLTFHGANREGEPWRTNFHGTRNVLQLCRESGIEDLHYVSTAYVCGLPPAENPVREDQLDVGQQFRNDYEQAKYEAERLVRSDDAITSLTVYRPGIIVGDSESGYMATYHGLGMYLKLMSVMIWNLEPDEHGVRHTPLHLHCTGQEPRNPVTVDWTSEVISRLFNNPEAHGGTYHVTPDTPMTAKQLIDYTGSYFNCTGVVFDAEEIGVNDFDAASHEQLSIYHDYLTTDPQFDRSNMRKFVPDLPSPVIDEPMIHRFLKFGDADRWGKNRQPAPQVPCWSDQLMRQLPFTGCDVDRAPPLRTIGLNIVGPGGGQYRVSIAGDAVLAVADGLPHAAEPVVHISTTELGQALRIDSRGGSIDPDHLDAVAVGERLACYLADAVERASCGPPSLESRGPQVRRRPTRRRQLQAVAED